MLQASTAAFDPAVVQREEVPVLQSGVSDAALQQLAIRESRLSSRLNRVIYDDPALRTEIQRVGLERGCVAVAESRREVSASYASALVPATVAAIRKLVPEPSLSEMRPLSFFVGPMRIYTRRIDDEIDVNAKPELSAAFEAMRTAFLLRTRTLPDKSEAVDPLAKPRADIAESVGITGLYDLDKASHVGMACADFLIDPRIRPTITTAPAPKVYTVIPTKPQPYRSSAKADRNP